MLLHQKNKTIILSSLSILFYFLMAHCLDRSNFTQLITQYFILFIPFLYFIKKEKNNFTFLVAIAIIFRLIFLTAIPNLSQDFYRFIWDGRMMLKGLNPYLYLPETFINQGNAPINQATELYSRNGGFKRKSLYKLPPY